MELELGLALSSNTNNHFATTPKLKELDLISHVNCNVNQVYDDDNSTLSSQSSANNDEEDDSLWYVNNHGMKKRSLKGEESSFVYLGTKTLPLLAWDKDPNEHNKRNKEPNGLCTSPSFAFNKSEEDGIVGWPPIKSQRKKKCQRNHQLLGRRRCFQVGENGGACGGFRSMYVVKVQMQGFFITRKIDLMLHHSYHALTPSLLALFGKGEDSVEKYKLAYQDKDGDWLLVGDIPWRTFVGSVRRLKLLRRED